MKSTPDPITTPEQKMNNFTAGLRQALSVSKSELAEREKAYKDEMCHAPKARAKA